jgi:hypothetical protein
MPQLSNLGQDSPRKRERERERERERIKLVKFFWNADINYFSFDHPLHLEDWRYSFAFCLFGFWLIQKNRLSPFIIPVSLTPVVAREGAYH